MKDKPSYYWDIKTGRLLKTFASKRCSYLLAAVLGVVMQELLGVFLFLTEPFISTLKSSFPAENYQCMIYEKFVNFFSSNLETVQHYACNEDLWRSDFCLTSAARCLNRSTCWMYKTELQFVLCKAICLQSFWNYLFYLPSVTLANM